jgi:hypothetical protein
VHIEKGAMNRREIFAEEDSSVFSAPSVLKIFEVDRQNKTFNTEGTEKKL